MLRTLKAYAQLARLPNLLMVGLTLWWPSKKIFELSTWMGGRPPAFADNKGLVWLMAVTVLSAFAGYVINDVYDRKIDAINRPQRPSVAFFSKKQLWITYVLGLIAVALATLAFFREMGLSGNRWALFLFPAVNLALYAYAAKLKCVALVGNFLVALLCALVPFSLILAAYKGRVLGLVSSEWLILLAIFAFLTTLMREVVKDMEDIQGDLAAGCRTFAGSVGLDSAKVFVLMIAVFEVLSFVWFGVLMGDWDTFFIFLKNDWWQVTGIFLPLLVALYFLLKKENAKASLWLKIHMLAGVLLVPLF